MTDVMIDIETYSTRPNATIMTLGAIRFNRNGSVPKLEDMDTFYRKIDIKSNMDLGRHIDPETQEWWSRQSGESKLEICSTEGRVSLKNALEDFKEWYGTANCVWSHGDDFDTVIVDDAMRDCGLTPPWKFWQTRDTRTLFDLSEITKNDMPNNKAHNALHDCYAQIIGVVKGLRRLGL